MREIALIKGNVLNENGIFGRRADKMQVVWGRHDHVCGMSAPQHIDVAKELEFTNNIARGIASNCEIDQALKKSFLQLQSAHPQL